MRGDRARTEAAGRGATGVGRGLPLRVAIYGAVLVAIWYVLSGRFDLLHFGTGAVAALVIAMRSRAVADGTRFYPLRFLLFVPWLIGQVVVSNVRVARIILSPRIPITPTLVRAPARVEGDRALTLLGASTTLTPGTLTVDVEHDGTVVHALDPRSVDDVRGGAMARRVGRVFGQAA